jgi:hypothetical protein
MRPLFCTLLILSACDEQPCHTADGGELCVGDLVVDASADPPTFTIDGMGEVSPDQLEVNLWLEGFVCEGGVSHSVWEVEKLPEGAMPVTYGVLPDGAREEAPAKKLVQGELYTVTFLVKSGPRTATSNQDWDAVFVAGDPESAQTMAEACPD